MGLANGPIQAPIKCDADGNLYLRIWNNSSPLAVPIVKIGHDGKLLATFSFDHVADLGKDLLVDDFVVDANSAVYALVEGQGSYLAKFRSDGELQSAKALSLGKDFEVKRLAVLGSGRLLLTGLKGEGREPKTLILDESGNIVQFVNTKETLRMDNNGKIAPEDMEGFEMTDMVVDQSGTIYLMRPSTPVRVLLFSAIGEFVRNFDVDPPEPGHFPISLAVSGGKIAIAFLERKDKRLGPKSAYRIIDASTGLAIIDYVPPPEIKGSFACYVAPAQFSMLWRNHDEGRFRLLTLSEP